jgi:hypothetical protein
LAISLSTYYYPHLPEEGGDGCIPLATPRFWGKSGGELTGGAYFRIKQLQRLDDPRKQTAEVAAYFKRFDEAEQCYLAMDRPDLAIELRMRLGDWFKVLRP